MRTRGRPAADAVLFDMDGTLIDSEPLTDVLILRLLEAHRLPAPEFELTRFHGIPWRGIEAALAERYPQLAGEALADRLQGDFHRLLLGELPPLVCGVERALAAASRALPVGVVSSSQRATVEAVLRRTGFDEYCRVVIAAEDVDRPKPDPACYRLAAGRLGAAPRHCIAFEDSSAGVQAARTAGMYTVGVVGNREAAAAAEALRDAHLVIADYDELPADFFSAPDGRR